MSTLNLIVSVVDRDRLALLMQIYEECHINVSYVALGRGTARSEILGALGIADSEKAVSFSIGTGKLFRQARKELRNRMNIDGAGSGILFTVPLGSVGGYRELRYFTYEQGYEKEEEGIMRNTKYALLVAISNQGYSEAVMDAAKKGGAGGGTIIRAQGTGKKDAEKFLGISLASDKDMLFIVSTIKQKNEIMQSIMREAGLETPAKAIVFSVPVTDTAGLRFPDEEDEIDAAAEAAETDTAEENADIDASTKTTDR